MMIYKLTITTIIVNILVDVSGLKLLLKNKNKQGKKKKKKKNPKSKIISSGMHNGQHTEELRVLKGLRMLYKQGNLSILGCKFYWKTKIYNLEWII